MSEAAAEQQQQQQQQPSAGRVAAAVARGCIGRPKVECTAEFAVSLLKKEFDLSAAAEDEIQRLQQIAEKVLKEVVEVASGSDEIEAFAAAAVDKEDPFEKNEKTKDAQASTPVATKAELQAAVKTLGMGPAAYRGLPKDNPAAYCKELQSRVLTFIKNISGDVLSSLPSAEQLSELKKAAEAKKELSSLDASNIIQGRPKRRAASSAAEAIKRDIQRELDREAAQASSQPHSKKQKTDKEEGAAAAASSSSSSSSSNGGDVAERKKAKEEEEEDEEDEDEDEDSSSDNSDESDDSSSNSSSGSSSSSNDDEEEEDEDED